MDYKHMPQELPKQVCKECGVAKPLFEFARQKTKCGISSKCKECSKKSRKISENEIMKHFKANQINFGRISY